MTRHDRYKDKSWVERMKGKGGITQQGARVTKSSNDFFGPTLHKERKKGRKGAFEGYLGLAYTQREPVGFPPTKENSYRHTKKKKTCRMYE